MTSWLVAPLALQAAAMFADEMHFHRRRGLPLWERVGHPLDTLTVLACLALAALAPPTRGAVAVYTVLAVFSCIFVTKDEPIHARLCTAGEHWLHAVLFLLHPVAFASIAALWLGGSQAVVVAQAMLTLGFAMYQALYWNVPRRPACKRSPTRAR